MMPANMSNMTLRPAIMAPKDGSKHWFVSSGRFFVEASWDDLCGMWVPNDAETRRSIRRGTCVFDPEFYVAVVEKPESTYWNGLAWVEYKEEMA